MENEDTKNTVFSMKFNPPQNKKTAVMAVRVVVGV